MRRRRFRASAGQATGREGATGNDPGCVSFRCGGLLTLWEHWENLPSSVGEPIKSYVGSTALALQATVQTAFGIGYGLGLCTTPDAAWHYFTAPAVWFGILAGVFGGVGPYHRARQGLVAAENTVPIAGGGTAVISPPKGS